MKTSQLHAAKLVSTYRRFGSKALASAFIFSAAIAQAQSTDKAAAPAVPDSWGAGPNTPTAVVRAIGVFFPANGKFYVMGGRSADTAGSDLLHPFEFTPSTNSWAT